MKTTLLICLMLFGAQSPNKMFYAANKELQAGNWKIASLKFGEAIDTGQLNIAGKSMAYWNIYVSEDNLGNIDKSMEALLGFIVYAADAIESTSPFYINWAKTSKIREKLLYAITFIQAKWANINNYSCRSKLFSCYIPSKKLISLFVEIIPFCHGQKINNIDAIMENNLLILNVDCKLKDLETYYFIKPNEL